ncbi:dihydropyrimidinase [Devosia submarina]|uniref:dihydropyrimidinase n=1 Tax=Devosia submarina TaxID=1173082 RepID=UPI001FE41940|nr:dihydropyrimidinase [Devosia submarina]
MLDLVIENGVVVTAAGASPADVGIKDGRIVQLGGDMGDAERIIDAQGNYVIPGGVDVHTHLDAPGNGHSSADDFLSGTIAAACGGTTTIVDFCQQARGQSLHEALDVWHAKARDKAVIDYGFHIIVVDFTPGVEAELIELPDEGVSSFKLFLAYKGAQMVDDRTVVRTLHQARRSGALVMVHAENGDAADFLVEQNLAAGNTAPIYHALSRPPLVEAEATNRAIVLAELAGAPIYIVHLTTRGSLDAVIAGRLRGVDVSAETCTHYLYSTQDDLGRENFEGAKWVFTPPARTVDDQALLWDALAFGTLQAVSSDHGSWSFGEHRQRGRNNFAEIPNGAVGIEERMMMVYQAVNQGRFSVSRFVDLVSTTPARLFGLYPQKGSIAVGSDADLVIWDPEAKTTITQSMLHHGGDYSLYEGQKVRGLPTTVVSRGEVIVEDRVFVGMAGRGRFIKRKRFDRGRL